MEQEGSRQKKRTSDELEALRQRVAELEALELEYKRDKSGFEQNYDTIFVTHSLLKLSLEDIPLDDVLDRALELLLSIPWLSFDSMGSIFLVEDDPATLVLKAQNNISPPLQSVCKRVSFGKCLCGRAASTGEIVFTSSLDDRHENRYKGMDDHGHYCVPIRYSDQVIGVINIYVKEGHQRVPREVEFLTAVANTLAGIVVRRKTEDALRKSEKKLRDVTSSVGEGVFLLDRSRAFAFVNPEAERLLGWTEKELLGKDFHDVIHKCRADGTSLSREECPVYSVIQSDKKYVSEEDQFYRKDGTAFPVSFITTPLVENGQVVGSISAFSDITEKKKMEGELIKVQRLESIGALASGIAHDFNNLLMAIWGNITLAKSHTSDEDDFINARLDDAEQAAKRAKDLARQLLIFARGGSPVTRRTSVEKLLRDSAAFALSGSKVKCSYFLPDDLWPVEVDEWQISQVIHNLVTNAQQAMQGDGKILIRCENVNVEEKDALPLKSGEYIKICVEDGGVGISKENLSRIFDPFFKTKPEGEGLGLSTSYSIVSKHGGHITAESELGRGTVVSVYLRAFRTTVSSQEWVADEEVSGKGMVLVMDDEEMVRAIAGMMLCRLGYDVEFARDGLDVVHFYKQALVSGKKFDAVIMDLTIPGGMGALETLKALQKLDPHVKAIVSSGYADDPILIEFRKHGFQAALPKPYQIIELSAALNAMVHKAAS